jgi:hypothetical protein
MDVKAELVRIASTGEAHAIGKVASQRLRARAGVYRTLPSPGHVVFLRYTGEDGRRDVSDGAVVRLAGEITHPGALCDILALVAQTGWRGELVVFEDLSSRSLFIDQGNVLGVTTSVEDERIGAVLYRYGALDSPQYAAISSQLESGKRFGDVAVSMGMLTQEQVFAHIRRQIEEVVCATLTISDGTFYFLDGFDDARLATRHAVNLNALLMDGVTRLDEMRYFRQKIPSANHVPVRTGSGEPPAQDFIETYSAVDGTRTVEEIGRITGLGEFGTTKALYALIQSKHVAIHPPQISGGQGALVALANEALRAIFVAVDSAGKGTQVRAGLSSFAVGAGVYDILFRGAGPNERGELDADRVAENSVVIASGGDPVNLLKQILHEYVGFALFCAGGVLPSRDEDDLMKDVSRILTLLRPIG